MTVRVLGLNQFTLKAQRPRYKKDQGWYFIQIYEGPQELLDTFLAAIPGSPDDVDVETGVPTVVTLSFSVAPGSVITLNDEATRAENDAIWELIPEVFTKRLESHGNFIKSGSSAAVLAKIDAAIKEGNSSDTDWDETYPGLGAFNAYRDLRLEGTDTYESYTWRVRKTVTVSKSAAVRPSFRNVGKIVTWNDIGVGQSAIIDQPSIHICSPYNVGWEDVLVDQWLAQPPGVTYMRQNHKYRIVCEWLGAVEASGTLYDGGKRSP